MILESVAPIFIFFNKDLLTNVVMQFRMDILRIGLTNLRVCEIATKRALATLIYNAFLMGEIFEV